MSYSHLTVSQRHHLYELRMTHKHSLNSIAQRMGRCKSTLSRELKRNRVKGQVKHQLSGDSCAKRTLYLPDTAEQMVLGTPRIRRQEAKTAFAKVSEGCVQEVKRRLALYHSPEQIAGRLKREGKEEVSHETI